MMIDRQFWDEISVFNDIIIPVSGGVDSTYLVYQFLWNDVDFRLVWNNTGRSLVSARETLTRIFKLGYEFDICYSFDDPGMISQKTKLAMRKIVLGKIKKVKKNIPCCWYLKEKPFKHWLWNNTDILNSVVISGIASYESMQRNIHLGVLRKRDTYLRFKVKEKRWFAYPLRDFNFNVNRQGMLDFLGYNFDLVVERSGCYTCPILVLFEKYLIEDEEERVRKSKKVYG